MIDVLNLWPLKPVSLVVNGLV